MSKIEDYANKSRGNAFEVMDALVDCMGAQETLEALCRALDNNVLANELAYISRVCDLDNEVAKYLGWTNEEEEGEEDE